MYPTAKSAYRSIWVKTFSVLMEIAHLPFWFAYFNIRFSVLYGRLAMKASLYYYFYKEASLSFHDAIDFLWEDVRIIL